MSSKKCKNYDGSNKVGYYKGDEPSPKGLGFCAKYEEEGTMLPGNDGNVWEVINGRWVKMKFSVNKSTKSKKSTKSRKPTERKQLKTKLFSHVKDKHHAWESYGPLTKEEMKKYKKKATKDIFIAYSGMSKKIPKGQTYYMRNNKILVGWHGTTNPPQGM